MANPVGEDSWVAYVDEASRSAKDLEQRVNIIELFKRAVSAEPAGLKVWTAYCEYFWSLYVDCQDREAGWPEEEQIMGRELFSLDAALELWQQGYRAIKYRIGDSHLLWDKWISLEMALLAKTKTPEGIKRITHLYRDRLRIPHVTWDDTASHFSNFLSEYNHAAWEETMKEVTSQAQDAKRIIHGRENFEFKLQQAQRSADETAYPSILRDYLDWEIAQSRRDKTNPELATAVCHGLFARALTGAFATDEQAWTDYVVFVSSSYSPTEPPQVMLDSIQRAIEHCPWSGPLWSRFILAAEEAKMPFHEVEKIKHSATSNPAIYKNGMTSLLDVYVAWCGFLKRTAMDINATEDAVDIADVGLSAALEDIEIVGKRTYGKAYKGDPNYRIERIYIQYLTEKKAAFDDARLLWHNLSKKQIYADSYDFWLSWYLWEMVVFGQADKTRSPTPSSAATGLRVPKMATSVLSSAVTRRSLDWPERIIEIFLQHCNDYELPSMVREAVDTVHKQRKGLVRRRQREAADANAAALAAQAQLLTPAGAEEEPIAQSPSGSKRKRGETPEAPEEKNNKKSRNEEVNGTSTVSANLSEQQKRDRENTTVVVTRLPKEVTVTKMRQYFKDYGHIVSIVPVLEEDSTSALIEFQTPEEAQSALLRDGKYFGESQIAVGPGTDLTLYMTNYPPAADDKYIRDLFKGCGEILSIRWPSLKLNTHRRFAYVTFRTRDGAAKATKLDGKMLEGKYKLVAKYSNPREKKTRDGATEEGRELVVKGLGQECTESELEDIFGKYGTVSRVNLIRNAAGKARGTAFVVMETKEQAQTAMTELDKTKLRNVIMHIELARPTNFKLVSRNTAGGDANTNSVASSPAPSRDEEGDEVMADPRNGTSEQVDNGKLQRGQSYARTVAVMGLPDTVNDARVRELAETVGEVRRVVLQPNHGGATVEFRDEATAGRAALALDGREFEGRTLRTGSVADLHRQKGVVRNDKLAYGREARKEKEKEKEREKADNKAGESKGFMPTPTTVRRPPVLGGRGGKKPGLGFVRAAPASKTGGAEGEAAKPMKSNADFKAMFLNGNGKKDEEGKEKAATAAAQNEDS